MISISLFWKYLFNNHFPYVEGILFACSLASTLSMVKREMKRWFPLLVVVTVILGVYFILNLAGFLF
ncbi:hypothetical protein BVG01_31080 [Bacillus anthracis]|nr:hypothetical protein BVG01_31080 [Bacillus anthracis]